MVLPVITHYMLFRFSPSESKGKKGESTGPRHYFIVSEFLQIVDNKESSTPLEKKRIINY